ncbi:MAG TPA: host attachment protein [Hyphomicrobium sp.]|nr:host attachment protein [Hyphomicrobium sp.]
MKPTVTWILIADGAHARLFANRGPGKGIEQLEVINGDHRPDSELVRDNLGRTFESVGDTRHAITPKTDPHRELKRDFAKHLGKVLEQGLAEKAYDRLVIVAPPAALGDLRASLSEPVKHAIYAELDKDLVKTPTDNLAEHLGAVMPI